LAQVALLPADKASHTLNCPVVAGVTATASAREAAMIDSLTKCAVSPNVRELAFKAELPPESVELPMKVLRCKSINSVADGGRCNNGNSMDVVACKLLDPLMSSVVGGTHQDGNEDVGSGGDVSSMDVPVCETLVTSVPSFANGVRKDDATVFPVPPGLHPPPGTPSHGSVLHSFGACNPCAFFWKPGGCKNGSECSHCHFCPEGEVKVRKKAKSALMRLGLVTPKQRTSSPHAVTFFLEDKLFATPPRFENDSEFEHDSESTRTGSSELELISGGSPSNMGTRFASSRSNSMDCTYSDNVEAEMAAVEADEMVTHKRPGFSLPLGVFDCSDALSAGSALHGTGKCEPCAWFYKPNGCRNAANCDYCHRCPDGEVKTRKRQKNAMKRLGLVTPKAVVERERKWILNLAECL